MNKQHQETSAAHVAAALVYCTYYRPKVDYLQGHMWYNCNKKRGLKGLYKYVFYILFAQEGFQ